MRRDAGGTIVWTVGFLDRAKKLAEQAKGVAEQAKGLAEDALADAKARTETSGRTSRSGSGDPRLGTPYVPGMLGRDGWRERGLTDPAAVLPIDDRELAGLARGTRSAIVEEPFGMGRRWSAGKRSAGLFYQLYPEHHSWEAPAGWVPLDDVPGASVADLPDGRSVVRFPVEDPVVLELSGLDDARITLARAVARQLAAS